MMKSNESFETKQFNHLSLIDTSKIPEVVVDQQHSKDGFRVYRDSDGTLYPSVTTVTSIATAHHIANWRANVGEEKADRVVKKASRRGTLIHKLCEHLINNEQQTVTSLYNETNWVDKEMFDSIRRTLVETVDNVILQEVSLASKFLKVAGTPDCVCDFNGKRAVVDFKTSARVKDISKVEHYFMQASAYCVMMEEVFNIPVDTIVIIIATQNEHSPTIFVKKRDEYINKFINLRKKFELANGF